MNTKEALQVKKKIKLKIVKNQQHYLRLYTVSTLSPKRGNILNENDENTQQNIHQENMSVKYIPP